MQSAAPVPPSPLLPLSNLTDSSTNPQLARTPVATHTEFPNNKSPAIPEDPSTDTDNGIHNGSSESSKDDTGDHVGTEDQSSEPALGLSSIDELQQALSHLPEADPARLPYLWALGTQFSHQYMTGKDMQDLNRVIQATREILDIVADDHPGKYKTLAICADALSLRYQKSQEASDLDEAINYGRALRSISDGTEADIAYHLARLGLRLASRYSDKSRSVPDLEEAVQAARESASLTTEDNPLHPSMLETLELRLSDLYSETGTMSCLDGSIEISRQLMAITSCDNPLHTHALLRLGFQLDERYSRTRMMDDLMEAIESGERVLISGAKGFHYYNTLDLLNRRLNLRYERNRSIDDIQQALQYARQSLLLAPRDYPFRYLLLHNLQSSLWTYYEHTGQLRHLEKAIETETEVIASVTEETPDRDHYLISLGILLEARFLKLGNIADIDEAIQLGRQAAALEQNVGRQKQRTLSRLGNYLSHRFDRTGVMEDIDEAICHGREALAIEGQAERGGLLNSLGVSLRHKYQATGIIGHLEESIQLGREAVAVTPVEHIAQASLLDNLGNRLEDRFERKSELSDLDESIDLGIKASNYIPSNHYHRVIFISNLSQRLRKRHMVTGSMGDLEEAIKFGRSALSATSKDDVEFSRRLSALGVLISDRYSETNSKDDLKEAISLSRQALDVTPEDHPQRAMRLNNLAIILTSNEDNRRPSPANIDEAIRLGQQAVKISSTGDPAFAALLHNLGGSFESRFYESRAKSDLEESVKYGKMAVAEAPVNHLSAASIHWMLAARHALQYSLDGKEDDLQEARRLCEIAFLHPNAPQMLRIAVGRTLLTIRANPTQRSMLAEQLMKMFPKLLHRSLNNLDKENVLGYVSGIASDLAELALSEGLSVSEAVSYLEQGRGMLATSQQDIRVDLSILEQFYPELARRFSQLREYLGQSESAEPDQYNERYKAGQQLDELIEEIRACPKFERFLLPPDEVELRSAAEFGPIVVINSSQHGCDAIIVEKHQMSRIPLPNLTMGEATEKANSGDLGSPLVLEWLWDVIACPILNALGFTETSNETCWPRVWWVPIGILQKFPIHAAGYHSEMAGNTVLDRVISSYSSSISALLRGHQRAITTVEQPSALLIGMGCTPGQSRLQFADPEVREVRDLVKAMGFDPVEPIRQKEQVLASLATCRILHFAGHGFTDSRSPSKSHLLLEDWNKTPLTVADLLDINLQESQPFLAYLSACGTGQVKNKRFFDESIHLISGFQLAGFRHVIGTLWEVQDELCLDMARLTYGAIAREGMIDEAVSRGLHNATRLLRDRWLEGAQPDGEMHGHEKVLEHIDNLSCDNPRDIKPIDSYGGLGVPYWVPYIHFGI